MTGRGPAPDPGAALEACFREEWPALVAAAARISGEVASAEEIVQDVMVAALARWPFSGVPDSPGAWLLTATRNRARNHVRDRTRQRAREAALGPVPPEPAAGAGEAPGILDDRLRLIFLCCHPTLSTEAQVALTLRLVCGLSARQIARAFLQPEATIAQRITRAKRALADARVPFAAPPPGEWSQRLPAVLGAVYLVFNEGYSTAEGPFAIHDELCEEALRLGRLLARLLPREAEVRGLVALMELHASRRAARLDDAGGVVLLADQDRGRWDGGRIAAGVAELGAARGLGDAGPLTLQAELAACHALAATWEDTDWSRIVSLYDRLLALSSSPVVALNRAVALAMRDGPEAGLEALVPIVEEGLLDDYHLLWATRADLTRRCHRPAQAAADYERALALATNPADRRHLTDRLAQCKGERAG